MIDDIIRCMLLKPSLKSLIERRHVIPRLLLCLFLAASGCSRDPDNAAPQPVPNAVAAQSATPVEFEPFLAWAQNELETQPPSVPTPTETPQVQQHWPVLRLGDPATLGQADIAAPQVKADSAAAALVEAGPFRSDQRTPNFDRRITRKRAQGSTDQLVLMISNLNFQTEEVGAIELRLLTPYGRHTILSWSRIGHLTIPVESHDEAYTVHIPTDGLADWKGKYRGFTLTMDGAGSEVVEIQSLRLLPRVSSYPLAAGRQRVRLSREIRDSIYVHCPSEITYHNIKLPRNARLRTGLGHVNDGENKARSEVRHQIILADGDESHVVLDCINDEALRWTDEASSLAQWAGKTVTLTLKTFEAAPGTAAFWANPTIYEPQADAPILVLYLIDTVAAEHIGFQGYSRPTMPRLEEAARSGVWFSHMYSNSSRTIESIPDMMLSMPTERHGVHHNSTPAPEELTTISDMLRAAGMATVSFVTNVNAGPRQGMDQGFDTFIDKISTFMDDVDRTIPLEEVLYWLEHNGDRPAFLYIHTAEPHAPYTPPEGYRNLYDPEYTGSFDGRKFHNVRNPRDVMHIRSLYDEELTYADARFGLFLDSLEQRDLLARSNVFVISDHGEEFLQHGRWEHGLNLHNEETRVPLTAFGPDVTQRGRIDVPVQTFDIMPTLLDMYGLKPPYELAGHTLQSLLRADTAPEASLAHRDIFGSNHNYRIEYGLYEYSIIENGRWKVLFGAIETPMYRNGPASRFTMYDLEDDPVERRNIINENQDDARRLIEKLVSWRLTQHVYEPSERKATVVDAEQMRELEAMGYAGEDVQPRNIKDGGDD